MTDEITQALVSALRECDEAMAYMSEYDIPICLPLRVKDALAKYESMHDLGCLNCLSLEADLHELLRVATENPSGLAGFIKDNYPSLTSESKHENHD